MTNQRGRKRALIRAHGSLADFKSRTEYEFTSVALVKDAIEGVGIPHPEVDLVSLNGFAVDFKTSLRDGDVLEVFPAGMKSHLYSPVRPRPLTNLRFIVDENSAKVANALLLLGFDTKYSRDFDDPRLAEISDTEDRILLTRDIGLLKRTRVQYGYWLRNDSPREQILEVIRRYALWDLRNPLSRCLKCNSSLRTVSQDEAKPFVPSGVWERHTEFFRCGDCAAVYWKGSHYLKMGEWLRDLGSRLGDERPNFTGDGTLTKDAAYDTEDDFSRRRIDQARDTQAPK